MATSEPSPPKPAAGLRFDPGAVLLKSPRDLIDPRFVGALHAELEEELGAADARVALFQIGYLHGLRDALRTVEGPFSSLQASAGPSVAPALAMRYRTHPSDLPGALEVFGSWPDRGEASARLATLGTCRQTACSLSAGYASGWLSGTFDAPLVALETECCARGDEQCRFVAREPEVWRARGEVAAEALIDSLPVPTLHALARADLDGDAAPVQNGAIDPDAAVIHIWGAVMVIPFSGVDETLQAVELIGRDPGARDVSVVVLDLTGALIDEAFGAVALERVVETIELWGAEAIFAGLSPLSEPVIAGLEHGPLVIHKDLEPAVADAFRIARSQRRLV